MDNQIAKGQKKLEDAIRLYELSAFDAYPSEQTEISYSFRYQQSIRRLMNKERKKRSVSKQSNTFSLSKKSFCFPYHCNKWIAGTLLAVIVAFGGITAISATQHTGISRWFVKVYENFTEVFFEKRDIAIAPQQLETVYLPTQIPADYTLLESSVQEYQAKTVWTNANGQKILLMQNMMDSKITLDHENAQIETLRFDEKKIVVIRKNEKKCYYWNTSEYSFSLIVPEALDDPQCLSIIFSLEKAEE